MRPSEIALVESLEVEAVGEKPARERRPHDHAEPARERQGQDRVLDAALEDAVLVLERGNRAYGERSLDLVGPMVRETPMPDLSFGDELQDRAPRLLDRDARIGVVRLEQIDPLAPEATEARLDVCPD